MRAARSRLRRRQRSAHDGRQLLDPVELRGDAPARRHRPRHADARRRRPARRAPGQPDDRGRARDPRRFRPEPRLRRSGGSRPRAPAAGRRGAEGPQSLPLDRPSGGPARHARQGDRPRDLRHRHPRRGHAARGRAARAAARDRAADNRQRGGGAGDAGRPLGSPPARRGGGGRRFLVAGRARAPKPCRSPGRIRPRRGPRRSRKPSPRRRCSPR
jgi:hypothetical protein